MITFHGYLIERYGWGIGRSTNVRSNVRDIIKNAEDPMLHKSGEFDHDTSSIAI